MDYGTLKRIGDAEARIAELELKMRRLDERVAMLCSMSDEIRALLQRSERRSTMSLRKGGH